MKQTRTHEISANTDSGDDFKWVSTIMVMVLLLSFIGASVYVLISSFMDAG